MTCERSCSMTARSSPCLLMRRSRAIDSCTPGSEFDSTWMTTEPSPESPGREDYLAA